MDIPALVGQLNALHPTDFKDDAERKSLYEAARAATFTSETSQDSIHRIVNAVRYPHHTNRLDSLANTYLAKQSVQTTVAKIAGDLELIGIMGKILTKSDEPLPTAALAEFTISDSVLLGMWPI